MTRGEAVNWLINIMADMGKAEHRELWHYEQALSEIREMLESEPERKKAKWIYTRPYSAINCSSCHHCSWSMPYEDLVKSFNYCPNCGADMRGDEHEDD